MKYIRTKYGKIGTFISEELGYAFHTYNIFYEYWKPNNEAIVKQADTIEELMMIDDLVFKKNGDIFVIVNQAYIDYYIEHKSVSKLFIKDIKGNYIKVAEENDKGELRLV